MPKDAHQDHAKTTKQLGFYAWMDRKYGRMLEWSLSHRPLMLGVAAVTVASAAFLYPYVGKELVPDDDQSEFSVNLRLPRGTSFDRTLEYMTPIEGELREALGTNLESMMTSIQNGSGNYSVQLTPLDQREQSQQELMQVARRTLSKYGTPASACRAAPTFPAPRPAAAVAAAAAAAAAGAAAATG